MPELIIHGKALENARWLCSLSLDNVEDLPPALHLPTKHFCLLVVMNAYHVADGLLYQFAESAVRRGAAYVCAWGPNCEHVHDIFDEACVTLLPESTERNVIMTTWHDQDTLDEAIWFAVTATWPASDYAEACQTVLCVTIDDQEWAKQVHGVVETFLTGEREA